MGLAYMYPFYWTSISNFGSQVWCGGYSKKPPFFGGFLSQMGAFGKGFE
jgi:hypothetical protein